MILPSSFMKRVIVWKASIHHYRSGPHWQLDIWYLIKGWNWFEPCFLLFAAPGLHLDNAPSFQSQPNTTAAVFTDSCTFNPRREEAGLIKESSCCCDQRRRTADSWTLTVQDSEPLTHRSAASGSEVEAGQLKVQPACFRLYQLFCRSNPPTLQHPPPATDPLQGTEEGKGQTNRDMSPVIKPRGWTRHMLGPFWGRGWNTVTSDLDVASRCQVSQSQTVSWFSETTEAQLGSQYFSKALMPPLIFCFGSWWETDI